MQSKNFYNKIEEYVKTLTKEEITIFINNIIRKIPESKFNEILLMTENTTSVINEADIKKELKEYKQKFKKIEEGLLYFYASEYEDYSSGWDNWTTEYSDKDNIGYFIDEAIEYAIELVNYKKYYYAKEILDLVLETDYKAYDEDCGYDSQISLTDLYENGLISTNTQLVCLYTIYATL